MGKEEFKKRLLYSGRQFDFSALTIPEATIEDIDTKAIETLRWKLKNPKVTFDIPEDDLDLLKSLHLVQSDKFTYVCIILLWTTLATRKYLPFSEISYWYRMTEWDSYNLDDFVWTWGYLLYADELWNRINSRNLRLNVPVWLWLDIDRVAFDEETIREAINNAVTHRDCYESKSTFLIQYPYRIQVISPWWFPGWINMENIADETKPRNKLLADALRMCNMVDEFWNWVNKMIANQLRFWKNMPDYSESTKTKVILTLDGSIADMGFAKYMIQLWDEKQKMLNNKQLTILWKIEKWEKIKSDNILIWLLNQWLIEKTWHNNYILCKKYYLYHGQKVDYTNKKPISEIEIKINIILNKYLWDHKSWLLKREIMSIEIFKKFSWMKIYNLLKKYKTDGYIEMDWKDRSKNTRWKLIKKLPIE